MGTGLLKPNISAIVGELYPEGGARRDAGFSIFYMGINIGALVGPLVTGYLGERVGWHLGFGAAGVGMVIGLITYRLRARKTLGNIGMAPASTDPAEHGRVKLTIAVGVGVIALLMALTMAGIIHINPVSLAQKMTVVIVGSALIYFIYLFVGGGLTTEEKKRVVDHHPAVHFRGDLLVGVRAGADFAESFCPRLYRSTRVRLGDAHTLAPGRQLGIRDRAGTCLRRRLDGPRPATARIPRAWRSSRAGLFFAGLGFVVMLFASNIVINGGGNVRVSAWWLVFSYFLQTIGELSLSPVGLSSMTKLAPFKFKGQMMGVWFMAAALGNLIAGLVGGNVDPEKLEQMPLLFKQTSIFLFIAAVVCALLVKPVGKMMTGVRAGDR